MDSVAFFLGFILVTGVAVHGAEAQTTVTGTVFCDRCKDGKLSALDYPLAGNIYTHLHRVDNTFFVCFNDVFFSFSVFCRIEYHGYLHRCKWATFADQRRNYQSGGKLHDEI